MGGPVGLLAPSSGTVKLMKTQSFRTQADDVPYSPLTPSKGLQAQLDTLLGDIAALEGDTLKLEEQRAKFVAELPALRLAVRSGARTLDDLIGVQGRVSALEGLLKEQHAELETLRPQVPPLREEVRTAEILEMVFRLTPEFTAAKAGLQTRFEALKTRVQTTLSGEAKKALEALTGHLESETTALNADSAQVQELGQEIVRLAKSIGAHTRIENLELRTFAREGNLNGGQNLSGDLPKTLTVATGPFTLTVDFAALRSSGH